MNTAKQVELVPTIDIEGLTTTNSTLSARDSKDNQEISWSGITYQAGNKVILDNCYGKVPVSARSH